MISAIIICITFAFAGCYGAKNNNSNFPLAKGNYWEFGSGDYRLRLSVDSVTVVNGLEYFVVKNTYTANSEVYYSRSYSFRVKEDGNVERLIQGLARIRALGNLPPDTPSDSVNIWYKFDAKVGESWESLANSSLFPSTVVSPFRITLESKNDTVVVAGKVLPNCYRFYIDELPSSDEEYREWFAEGVGMVKLQFEGTGSDILRNFYVAK
jgi:hypothetical protein